MIYLEQYNMISQIYSAKHFFYNNMEVLFVILLNKIIYLDSMRFFAASAYMDSCFRASAVYLGLANLNGISFIISLYILKDTSG